MLSRDTLASEKPRPEQASWLERLRARLLAFDASFPVALKIGLPVMIAGAAVAGVTFSTLYRSETNRIRSDFEQRALLLTRSLETSTAMHSPATGAENTLVADLQRHMDALAAVEPSVLLINAYAARDGVPTVVASTDPGTPDQEEASDDAAEDIEALSASTPLTEETALHDEDALEVTLPMAIGGSPQIVVGAYFSTAERDEALAALLRTSVTAGAVGIGLALASLLLTLRQLIFRRLRRLLAATGRIGAGDYAARVEGPQHPRARDEMVQLAAASTRWRKPSSAFTPRSRSRRLPTN